MNLNNRLQGVTERNEDTARGETRTTTRASQSKPAWFHLFSWANWFLKHSWRGAVIGAVLSTGFYLFLNLWPQHLGRGSFLPDLLIPLFLVGVIIFLSGALADLVWLIIRLFSRLIGWILQLARVPEKQAQILPRAVKAVPLWFVRGTGCVLLLFAIFYFLIGQQGPSFTLLWLFVVFETFCGAFIGAALPLPVKSGFGFFYSIKSPSMSNKAPANAALSGPRVSPSSPDTKPAIRRYIPTPVRLSLAGLPLLLNLSLVGWLFYPGSDDYLVRETPPPLAVAQLSLPNPGLPGPFKVATFFYGSGTDQNRSQYAAGVAFKTAPVDASKLLPEWSGFSGSMLDWTWGFGSNALPLNGQVWYPAPLAPANPAPTGENHDPSRLKLAENSGPFPLVLLVHGNHAMLDDSTGGYAYLGELLASRGYIAVSVDENFLNGWAFGDFNHKETPVRAWLLLQHLRNWQSWNQDAANPFYHRVDLTNIGLVGHSRGGEAVALAAGFAGWGKYLDISTEEYEALKIPVKAVVSIAPADTYRIFNQGVTLHDTDYLLLQGSHDSDVDTNMGIRQYKDVNFTGTQAHFKTAVYIYRANHSRFNPAWGEADSPLPFSLLLNQQPILSDAQQQQIARVYIASFMESSLHGKQGYLAFLKNHYTARDWLPDDIYLTRFASSNLNQVANFDNYTKTLTGPAGSEEGTIQAENFTNWEETNLTFRDTKQSSQFNRAVFLSWQNPNPNSSENLPRYTLNLPAKFKSGGQSAPGSNAQLVFELGQAGTNLQPVDFTIELLDASGNTARVPLSATGYGPLHPSLVSRFTKAPWLAGFATAGPVEQVLQTYEVQFSLFTAANRRFDPTQLATIRLIFDRTASGAIMVDNIGFD
ncbi:MAG: hypothetical protein J0I20_05875 [Chloroflexi bacterium]|nr:hypothetical protein [Chloroflexota bacterium]OJV90127.1 MAG: hypothetical protein BGO39_01805 [Chloroflexi bacterium 54-19]